MKKLALALECLGDAFALDGVAHRMNEEPRFDVAFDQIILGALLDGLDGDLLVIGWGSTIGAIEEAVDRARADGLAVSALHLRFLSPLEPGLTSIFSRFTRVMTVEINYSDDIGAPFITEENRRRGQLAMLLRAATLVDVDCWTRVPGEPLRPGAILGAIRSRMPRGGAK